MKPCSLLNICRSSILFASAVTGLLAGCTGKTADTAITNDPTPSAAGVISDSRCDKGNGDITLPAGFCATVFADNLGHARHLAVAPNGDVYVNTWSSQYTGMKNAPGGFVVALRDADRNGHAEMIERFGAVYREGQAGGGTGIAVYGDALYVEAEGKIVRYPMSRDSLVPKGNPETILGGLPADGDHPMHSFVIAPNGTLYVNSGSASNACQVKNRERESPGRMPCPELPLRAGIWRYDANKTGQVHSPQARYATGTRNTVALAFDAPGDALYAVLHGRDQLSGNWPRLYTDEQNNRLPAEVLARISQGDDFGWPYCYYDAMQAAQVRAPEYGGDGGKVKGDCVKRKRPDLTFPAHWAPEAVVFYSGAMFPVKYRGGAFVSFHGSWNRAPTQAGFLVAFVPFNAGKPAGRYEEFATGFAGAQPPADPAQAAHRPMGLAVGPDGALYVSDDAKGRIWRIVYVGGA